VETIRDLVVAVPAIAANVNADVVLAADAAWKGETAVDVTTIGAPLAGLQVVGVWVSNPATGALTVRFSAGVGGVAAGNQSLRLRGAPSRGA
jgi:hypothetical protein